MIKVLIGYWIIINIIAFLLMGEDKRRAKKQLWRIPEKTLFLVVAIGGSIGGLFGMQFFRHKTKHRSFTIGFPLLFILHIVIGILVWFMKFT